MIGFALNWLRGNWTTVVVGAGIVALAIYLGSLYMQLGIAKGRVATLEAENAHLEQRVTEWRLAHEVLARKTIEQSKAVDDWKAASDKKRKDALEALNAAEARVGYTQRVLDAVAARDESRQPSQTCSKAVADAKNDLAGMNQ